MTKLYQYVGPDDIRKKVSNAPPGYRILNLNDLVTWLQSPQQKPDDFGIIWATFVINQAGNLLLADRHSEHVACASGEPVLSAGEISFAYKDNRLEVVEISNQSTGYCPEPESWPAVKKALDRIPVHHPDHFTYELIFRRCPSCGQRNIVKDGWFVCGYCNAELPSVWNFTEELSES